MFHNHLIFWGKILGLFVPGYLADFGGMASAGRGFHLFFFSPLLFCLQLYEMLKPESMQEIVSLTRQRMESETM